ncbi:HdeD family acid-resistance protein [Mycobacterium sp. M1]|uniref:HdeD family acid-resistance protein n=1 Tax=Mycolicibacter acidiphilus TaxID=2835306 RepID=A0ABS5RJR5_9MYCO|nr:HdeD family acid-resistance protein [Mycolicibacter acidiphilus]MBS9534526.1 HdeD family acid-resistance protein [Mycolicibacter acidiphilus]
MTTTAPAEFEGPLHQFARNAWQALLVLGALTIVFGVAILAWPGKTLVVAGALFGAYLVVSGIMQLLTAFGTHLSAALRVLAFVSGIVSMILGMFCFRDKLESILLLAIWIGIGWVFRGVTLLIAALSSPVMPARGWQIFSGIVIAVGGSVLISYPFDSIAFLTLMTGGWLIAIGVVEIIDAFQVRRRVNTLAEL